MDLFSWIFVIALIWIMIVALSYCWYTVFQVLKTSDEDLSRSARDGDQAARSARGYIGALGSRFST